MPPESSPQKSTPTILRDLGIYIVTVKWKLDAIVKENEPPRMNKTKKFLKFKNIIAVGVWG